MAAGCGIDEASAERLLNALAGLGLLEFYEGRWRSLQPDLSGLGRMTMMWDHLDVALWEGQLLSILYEALVPGGALAIADIVPDHRPSSRSAWLCELGLHLRTGSGGVHRLDAYRERLADIGFKPPDIHELLGEFPLKLIIARKSGGRSLGAASR